MPGRDAKRRLMRTRNDLVTDPVGTGAFEEDFEKTIETGTGKQHNPNAQAGPGIHTPVNRGHKEDIEDLASELRDYAHDALQRRTKRL